MVALSGDRRPLLLVDVDDVLLPFGRRLGKPDEHVARFVVDGLEFRMALDVRRNLRLLHDAFECVWGTAWEHRAPFILGPRLGYGVEWPVITFDVDGDGPTWKLPSIVEWCEANAEGRAVVWIDDDLGWDAVAWAAQRPRTLLLPTDPAIGLTDEHVEMALASTTVLT